jgi:pyruvate/2-oxoacid:ferredoxin oxidoreductase alpha subunit
MFVVWNRGYKTQHVIALDAEEALAISQSSGHTRRGYRKYKELTDEVRAAENGIYGNEDAMRAALNFGRSGVATLNIDEGWCIDGKPTWKGDQEPEQGEPCDD